MISPFRFSSQQRQELLRMREYDSSGLVLFQSQQNVLQMMTFDIT